MWNRESWDFHLRLESGIQVPLTRNPESETVVDYLTCMKEAVSFLAKFVVARCAFSKLRRNFAFSVPSIILADLLGNKCYLHEFKRSWFAIRDRWISIRFVCFVFQSSLLCDRPVSGNNRPVKIASQIFLLFLILVTCNNKVTSPSFLRKKSTHHRDFLRYS